MRGFSPRPILKRLNAPLDKSVPVHAGIFADVILIRDRSLHARF
jgi:hypothetical protein